MDKNHGLQTEAEINGAHERREEFEEAGRQVLIHRSIQTRYPEDDERRIVSYPIFVNSIDHGHQVAGILNVGGNPKDLEFFQDLANQAALGIVHAKLVHELERSRQALEGKVEELMVLSLMGMALQRNALVYDDFQRENLKLLARCLTQIAFPARRYSSMPRKETF